jgi:hypothetical protein
MDYEGIMDIIMKILCVLGISNWHSKIAQVLWPKSIYIIYLIHVKFLNSIIQFTCSGTPVLYGAGYAKSDFTTCLPVPRRCCGQLGRSEQAAFLGPDFGESVLTAVLHRSQHWPGSPKQAQTCPNGSTNSIVLETPAFAEIRSICFGFWCAKNGVLNQFSHSFIEIPLSACHCEKPAQSYWLICLLKLEDS